VVAALRMQHPGQMRANAAMVAMFGFTTEADMLSHIKAGEGGWYVDPGRRAQFREQLEAHGAVRNFISEMQRHGSGETFWINENAHVVRDAQGTILYHEGTVEDVTERKEAETTLQMTLDNAGRGIARISAQGAVVLYNQRLLELLDLPEALLATRPLARRCLGIPKAAWRLWCQLRIA
jgi:PAS domain S-box-containing protein